MIVRALFLICLLAWPVPVFAQPLNRFTTSPTPNGPVIEFNDGDYILADGVQTPASGWKHAANPYIFRMNETGWRTGDYHMLVGRFRFDRGALGRGPFAFYTVSTRNQFSVSLNGSEIFRNHAAASDRKLAWYRPYLAPIPLTALRPGTNELVVRTVSQDTVGIGRIILGPNAAVQAYYQSQYFWQITAPMAANFAMLVLGMLALLLWLALRREGELLWLSISTALWFLRNYQYFAEVTPFDMAAFNALTVYATYFAAAATLAFYLHFVQLPHRNRIIVAAFLLGIPLSAAHAVLLASNLIFYIPSTAIALGMAVLGFIEMRGGKGVDHKVLGAIMLTLPLTSIYDVLAANLDRGWNGGDFYVAVFNGFLYCVAFLMAFGLRALIAFADLGKANITLEQRIAETRAELAASEAARQELVVGNALAHERERLMQEMHDGIGSNLITALAVARQQKQPAATIKTLSRAVADLKITVDSLEPVEGDLVALIGNLRHRMAGDLRDAGVACKWEVDACGPLPWLDATNALYVLRIFQEAIGNVLTHAGATEMRIGCKEMGRDGVPGLIAYVADNGCGFDAGNGAARGKGLANVRARARSLHGALEYETEPGNGTVVTLWLPYVRAEQLSGV